MKKVQSNSWAKLLEEEISKEAVLPDNAITCTEFTRQSGLSRYGAQRLLSRLIKNGKVRPVEGRTILKNGHSIKTTCYVMESD